VRGVALALGTVAAIAAAGAVRRTVRRQGGRAFTPIGPTLTNAARSHPLACSECGRYAFRQYTRYGEVTPLLAVDEKEKKLLLGGGSEIMYDDEWEPFPGRITVECPFGHRWPLPEGWSVQTP
jgi:hypothetical protein